MYILSREIAWFYPLPTIVRNPNPDWGIAYEIKSYRIQRKTIQS